jgi:hydroxyethylthiazole kinase
MDPYSPRSMIERLDAMRARRPLVQNITNSVAMTISANVLLAAGASPAMVHAEEEIADFAAISSALVINIGTLSMPWIASMKLAAAEFSAVGKPWVLDPVGVGATRLRNETSAALLALKPSIVRGNAGEIMALCGLSGATKGVDSTAGSGEAIRSAMDLAARIGSVVAITGETDYVTDGKRVVSITGGHALMPLSTALGCSLSALAGGFAAVCDPFDAAVSALSVYGAAGAIAGKAASGPGMIPALLCDALYAMDEQKLAANSTISEVAV